jgi:hypothetical protein
VVTVIDGSDIVTSSHSTLFPVSPELRRNILFSFPKIYVLKEINNIDNGVLQIKCKDI